MNTIKKRLMACLLAVVMVLSLLPTTAFAEEETVATVTGNQTIEANGTYQLAADATGVITIAEGVTQVKLIGNGATWDEEYKMTSTPNSYLYIDASQAQGITLELEDVYISNDLNGSVYQNTIDFSGYGNVLTISGTCVIDHDGNARGKAGIHVGNDTSLTINGDGTLYFYKREQGAGIGGNSRELNGEIFFEMTGSAFIKGTKQGAVIGAGSGSSSVSGTPGAIHFVSGTYNLIGMARGGVVGGSAGSSGGSSGTTVYLEAGASVNINVDYSGAAVGGGGYSQGNDSSGGTLYVNGGSIRCYIDENAASNVNTGWQGKTLTAGVNDAVITAQRLNGDGEPVYLLTFDTAQLAESTTLIEAYVDGNLFYQGGLHQYGFCYETVNRTTDPYSGAGTTTPSNWYLNEDETNLYFYVTGEDHTLTVNGQTFLYDYDEETQTIQLHSNHTYVHGICSKCGAQGYDLDQWDGTLDFTWYDETDVQDSYTLYTEAEWEALAWICSENLSQLKELGEGTYTNGNVTQVIGTVPSAQNCFTGVNFYLANDLDFGAVQAEDGTWSGTYNYYPIGCQGINDLGTSNWYGLFFGSMDGQGHTVANVYCDRGSGMDYQSVGLFGRVGAADGKDRPDTNIVIENLAVTGYIHSGRSVGGIVGKTLSVGSGYSIEVRNCVNYATVTSTDKKGVGGIVGALWNTASISNCINFGTVANAGGNVCGGITGDNDNKNYIYNCVNVGTVTTTTLKVVNPKLGALIGRVTDSAYAVNCYYLEGCVDSRLNLSGDNYSDDNNSGVVYYGTSVTEAELKSIAMVELLGDAYQANCGGYPVLAWQTATAHEAGDPVVATAPTCTEDGVQNTFCAVCGELMSTEVLTATGHSYTPVVTQPTCTEEGYTTYTCDNCDDCYVDDKTEATGHQWGEAVVSVEDGVGVLTYPCQNCTETKRETFELPQITVDPETQVTAVGDSAVFSVTATGEGLKYQWEYSRDGGVTWKTSTTKGNKTATATVAMTKNRDGQLYRCVVTDVHGLTVTSQAAAVYAVAAITGNPATTVEEVGATATFTVTAIGQNLTYQWEYSRDGETWKTSAAKGNKTATISLSATTNRNGLQYRCVVTDASGNSVTSKAATLYTVATITKTVKNVKASVGDTVTFTVTAVGQNLKYQWEYSRDGETWKTSTAKGNKTATITLSATANRSGLQYRCMVTDKSGNTVTSNAATLTVK